MKITDTVFMKMDEQGRITERQHSVEIEDCDTDRGYDEATLQGVGHIRRTSLDNIFAAVKDYREANQWN